MPSQPWRSYQGDCCWNPIDSIISHLEEYFSTSVFRFVLIQPTHVTCEPHLYLTHHAHCYKIHCWNVWSFTALYITKLRWIQAKWHWLIQVTTLYSIKVLAECKTNISSLQHTWNNYFDFCDLCWGSPSANKALKRTEQPYNINTVDSGSCPTCLMAHPAR